MANTILLILVFTNTLLLATSDKKKWNGGKLQAEMTIESSFENGLRLRAGEAVDIILSFIPQATCSELVTLIRGSDGVEILSAEERQEPECRPAQAINRTVRVRVPANTNGYVVAEAQFMVNGEKRGMTKSFAVRDRNMPQALKAQPAATSGVERYREMPGMEVIRNK